MPESLNIKSEFRECDTLRVTRNKHVVQLDTICMQMEDLTAYGISYENAEKLRDYLTKAIEEKKAGVNLPRCTHHKKG